MRGLVIAPMQQELQSLCSTWERMGHSPATIQIGRLPAVRFPSMGITAACGGLGKAQFALQTQHLLDHSSGWDCVVCAGAAGALTDDLAAGDVVVGTWVIEHDYNNKFNARPLPRYECDVESTTRLLAFSGSFNFCVRAGGIASGDEDIVQAERRQSLRAQTSAVAVAWEGAGGARACAFSGVPFVEVRGITDAAGATAPDDFQTNLTRAMEHVARLVSAWAS